MRIVSLELHNFRCFTNLKLSFTKPITLISGPNGIGKTSLLEALHYMSYLRSFKAISSKEMIRLDTPACAITTTIASEFSFDTLYARISQNKRSIKLNEKTISSFKELHKVYKAITLTEDDIALIQGSPALRRLFIDHTLLLIDPTFGSILRKYRHVLQNRNALVASYKVDYDSYLIWTKQLLEISHIIAQKRIELLNKLQQLCSKLIPTINLPASSLSFTYTPALSISGYTSETELLKEQTQLFKQETHYKRSLFGAHLDDFTITFLDLTSRTYASRGQQKLIVFLLKLAQLKLITAQQETPLQVPAVLLIDDFMTDFDQARSTALISLISSCASHTIFTCPGSSALESRLAALEPQVICLS